MVKNCKTECENNNSEIRTFIKTSKYWKWDWMSIKDIESNNNSEIRIFHKTNDPLSKK